MLLARNGWGALAVSRCWDWTSLCSCYDCNRHLSNHHRRTLEKQGLLLTDPEEYTAHPRPHSKITVQKERTQTLRSAFIEVKNVMPRVLWVHSLLLNFNRVLIKACKEKNRVTQIPANWIQQHKNYAPWPSEICPGNAIWFNTWKAIL